MSDREGAYGELLAAEAHYLRSRGWVPFIQEGRASAGLTSAVSRIRWRDPKRPTFLGEQAEAVDVERRREISDER